MSQRTTQLAIGDPVIDRDADGPPTPARVVELPDETADERFIPEINETVADANPNYPPDDRVAGIRFERRDGEPAGRTYHYPTSRLERVGDEWEPPQISAARREREETIEQHANAFEAFTVAVRSLANYPKRSAEWFDRHYEGTVRPATRGECANTREDEYRPNTNGAIVCWTCNEGGWRPKKLLVDDDVPYDAPCRTYATRDPSPALENWFCERVAEGNTDPRLSEDVIKSIEPNAEFVYLALNARQLLDENDRRRRSAILRIAYEATIGGVLDEEYNYSRTCAYLRDLRVDTDAVLPGGDPHVRGGESR